MRPVLGRLCPPLNLSLAPSPWSGQGMTQQSGDGENRTLGMWRGSGKDTHADVCGQPRGPVGRPGLHPHLPQLKLPPQPALDPGVLPPALTPRGPHLWRPLTHTPPPPHTHAHMLIIAPTPSWSRTVPEPTLAARFAAPSSRTLAGGTTLAVLRPLARRPGRARAPSTVTPSFQPVGLALPRQASRDAGSRHRRRPSPRSLREYPTLLLLLPLLLFPPGPPVLGSPPRLICDNRVLERYILEAKEAENVTVGCAEDCSLGENITVPDTKVNFYAWNRMEVSQQAMEVWQGLALLSEAIFRGQALLVNSSGPSEILKLHMDKAVSGLRSLTSLLRALGVQKEATSVPDAALASPLRTFTVDTLCKLFRIYSNFLRGKLKLYAGEACRRGDR
ncbi:PREDICTED: uncharacterized protein LOC102839176 [Chrysochloris asiatica]|uniref:Erythropoietin n=1 Tax=Chrysochloris asiatica TaxID=185453 RepID=A0A9B0TE29_CHRAS|nr:PREDICTED: uncharacterized protein LOC102839176 [Chrysochloris asiatica]